MSSERITNHGYLRMKERVGIKNISAMERMLDLAINRGYKTEDLKKRFSKKMKIQQDSETYLIFYNGYYFVLSNDENRLVTVIKAHNEDIRSFNAFLSKSQAQ